MAISIDDTLVTREQLRQRATDLLPILKERAARTELDAYTDYERRLTNLVRATEDAKEGREAFREKQTPRFSGR